MFSFVANISDLSWNQRERFSQRAALMQHTWVIQIVPLGHSLIGPTVSMACRSGLFGIFFASLRPPPPQSVSLTRTTLTETGPKVLQ